MCSLISPSAICLGVIIFFLSIYIFLFNTFYSSLRVNHTDRTEDELITKSLCERPFVQIGKNCYFFSAMNTPKEYYKIKYKDHYYSVPTKINWLETSFSCQTLDHDAHPISIETAKEMEDIAFFMITQNYPLMYKFWSSGRRSLKDDMVITNDYIWHQEENPMKFTNWLIGEPRQFKYPEGLCINLQLFLDDLYMATTDCFAKLPYVCELDNFFEMEINDIFSN